MKFKLLTLCSAFISLCTFAQEPVVGNYNYNKSVFRGYERIPANAENNATTLQIAAQHFPSWKVNLDKVNGSFSNLFGNAISVAGNTLSDKATYLFDHQLQAFGIDKTQWTQTSVTEAPRAGYVSFRQQINGRPVAFSNLQMRFTKDNRLVQITQKNFGTNGSNQIPVLTETDAENAAVSDISNASFTSISTADEWEWMPVPKANGYELRPAWIVTATGTREDKVPAILKVYVDAINGAVLYRSNKVEETVERTVQGSVFAQNPTVAATLQPLKDLEIDINGTTFYTNDTGFYSASAFNAPVVATMRLQGLWSKVNADDMGGITPTFTDTIVVSGGTYIYPETTPFSNRHVNAYYHTTRAHDFMRPFYPSFTALDIQLPTNVDVSGNCNAYYDGSSINFLTAGSGCTSFALVGDIVYHEYGHGISDMFYGQIGNTNFNNGALGEGNSDVWGMSITDNPVLGKGSSTGIGGGFIRRYDINPKVYPQDIMGEVHDDGEIIAGAWWDTRVNINSIDTMTLLFADTYYSLPNGPDGTEGQVYYDVLIAALLSDDDDGNIANGTPHFIEIVQAFAKHGIYLLADANLIHTEIANQPAPSTSPIPVTANVTVSTPAFLSHVYLIYRNRTNTGNWDTLSMVNTSGTTYSATLPPLATGIYDYHFTLTDSLNTSDLRFPKGFTTIGSLLNSNIPYQFSVGMKVTTSIDFETPATDWEIGNVSGDNATAGIWIQGVPIGSKVLTNQGSIFVQTNNDHTLNNNMGQCLLTGNAQTVNSPIGTADVDNGKTTVLSPIFDISGFSQPIVAYWRWFSNDMGSNPGQDEWSVQIRNTDNNIWQYAERTKQADASWRRRIFFTDQYVAGAQQIQLRFVAQDAAPGSIVEAAIDDFIIMDKDALSVQNIEINLATVYPNPADNSIKINLIKSSSGSIQLTDITGRLISTIPISEGTLQYDINTSKLAGGAYMLSIHANGIIQVKQIQVRH